MSDIELRILIIDDNPDIHQDFIKVLTTAHYEDHSDNQNVSVLTTDASLPEFQFDTAASGQDAADKVQSAAAKNQPFALAFIDLKMPTGWDGIETIKQLWEIDKDIQIVLCTIYADNGWEETIQKLGIRDNLLVLRKPFDNISVKQLACALTRKWLLTKETQNYAQLLDQTVAQETSSLKQSLSLLRGTLESSSNGILVSNVDGKIIDHNQQFLTLWDIPESAFVIKESSLIWEYMLDKLVDPEELFEQCKNLYKNSDKSSVQALKLCNGKIIECSSRPHYVNGAIIGRVWCFNDITQQSSVQQKLEYQATHDPLTHLPNRILLHDRIQQAIAASIRKNMNFAVLFMDLDRFKLVNDSLSHETGDKLLQAVSMRLASLIRKQDTLARLGGDEFVIILPELAKEEHVVNIAQKILISFEKPFHLAKRILNMKTSIGISIYPKDGTSINMLLKNADLAMYQAKEFGGNQFKFYTEALHEQTKNRQSQEMRLRDALINNEFFLLYQPQFDINSHLLLSVEALIRWQHPKQGVVLPLDFIPTAEESGLIVPIGEWVIREVCRQINRWREEGLPYLRVAVNVTTHQLKQINFAESVKNILEEFNIEPHYLEIEITENVIITHNEVIRMIKLLKKVGVTIVLDDFGTENSSLNYLKQVHIDSLKLDRSFVQNITKSRSDEVIMEAIMTMAQSLNFKVVAEGVETQKQINFLKNQHCDEIQGFFLSKPLPADFITAFFKKEIAFNKNTE